MLDTLAGAKVNLAARLMQASSKMIAEAPEKGGCVLVEQETFNMSEESNCEWTTLTPIKVKGKEEPVAIFKPSPPNPMIKRVKSGLTTSKSGREVRGHSHGHSVGHSVRHARPPRKRF